MTYDEPKILIRLFIPGDKLPPIIVETSKYMDFEQMVDKSLPLIEQKFSLRRFSRFPHDPEHKTRH